eukprot:CAMPEP_0177641846 /NCGR_PEP_ID=MMETSP0447-20121125/7277_1 /TAXON_ID=0 /ORGANISM="Stygamoeba regulata, Strain BSH-02190019" /LENGTH=82 /DNA_ID=CAMNT_0019143977 /DNA_START=313 /DNA_END=558 /DNA_ORIENTATION=-
MHAPVSSWAEGKGLAAGAGVFCWCKCMVHLLLTPTHPGWLLCQVASLALDFRISAFKSGEGRTLGAHGAVLLSVHGHTGPPC